MTAGALKCMIFCSSFSQLQELSHFILLPFEDLEDKLKKIALSVFKQVANHHFTSILDEQSSALRVYLVFWFCILFQENNEDSSRSKMSSFRIYEVHFAIQPKLSLNAFFSFCRKKTFFQKRSI